MQTPNLPCLTVHQRALHYALGNAAKPNHRSARIWGFFACRQHLRSQMEMCISFWGEVVQGFIPLRLMLPSQ